MRDVYFDTDFPQSYVMWLFFATIGSILFIMSLVRDNTEDIPQAYLRRKIIELTPDDEKVASKPVTFSKREHKETRKLVQQSN